LKEELERPGIYATAIHIPHATKSTYVAVEVRSRVFRVKTEKVLRTWIARERKIAELEEFGGRTRQEQQELEEEQRRIQLCSHR